MAAADPADPAGPGEGDGLSPSLQRNIVTLDRRRKAETEAAGLRARIPTVVSEIAGSLGFILLHLVLCAGWVAVNAGWVPWVAPFDPSFGLLGTVASVEGLILASFVLINQNRSSALAERRAELALHIGLLTEDELTQLSTVVTAIAAKLEVAIPGDHGIHEVKRAVVPDDVLDELDQQKKS